MGCEEEMAVIKAKRAEMKEGDETEAARAKCARKLAERPPGLQQPEGQKEKEGKSGQNGNGGTGREGEGKRASFREIDKTNIAVIQRGVVHEEDRVQNERRGGSSGNRSGVENCRTKVTERRRCWEKSMGRNWRRRGGSEEMEQAREEQELLWQLAGKKVRPSGK